MIRSLSRIVALLLAGCPAAAFAQLGVAGEPAASNMSGVNDNPSANPDKLNYGSYGNGSQPNLLFETIRAKTGARIQQVPFRGIAPAITATP